MVRLEFKLTMAISRLSCSYIRKKDPNFVPLKRSQKKNFSNHGDTRHSRPEISDSEITSETLIGLLSSYNQQQIQQKQQSKQLKNSQLQRLVSLIGLENLSSDQLHLQVFPPEPRVFFSINELPYPPEVIDDISTFFANRYTIPRALLGILCARSCKLSKYMPYLCELNEDVSETLMQYAKKMFDSEDISLNGLFTNINFALYYMFSGRYMNMWVYFSSFMSLIRLLRLNEDPNVIEQDNVIKFSLLEKEMRRRTWWNLRTICISQNKLLKDYPAHNVLTPISNDEFESLVETQEIILPLNPIARHHNIELIAYEIISWRERITHFHLTACSQLDKSFDFTGLLIQATSIQIDFQHWFDNQPNWFRDVLESNNVCVSRMPPKDSGQIPWLAVNLHMLYYSLSTFPYRFLLMFISKSKILESVQREISKEFISVSIGFCRRFQRCMSETLKNCILRLDPNSVHFHPINLFALSHSTLFSSVMSHFDETEVLRLSARNDFDFLISYLKKVALAGQHRTVVTIIDDMENFDKLPPGDLKCRVIRYLWTSSSYSYGLYGFQTPN
ncbi:hypothetical protein HK096_004579 [Nowakowskiella sp. JEL0078]|nr:hypothetical protein HK096_004579 [Nowakowskiella sp. JEL0078]